MKLNCVIVEDEPLARGLLEQYISKVPYLELVRSISNPVEALEVLRGSEVDILFLDVQMPEITGITLLKLLKNRPSVILTTAYSEYAIEGYELDVTDYLLKPITFERFLKSVEKASARLTPSEVSMRVQEVRDVEETNSEPFFFVKDGTKLVKIKFSEIRFIEGLKDYVRIHTLKKKITTLQRMKSLEDLLPSNQFLRVHHSFIVGLNWIEEVDRDGLQIGDNLVPVSDTYRKAFKEYLEQKQLGKG